VNVAPGAVVTIDVELWDFWGNLLRKTEEPLSYLHGGDDGILPALEAALEGREPGAMVEARLEPEDAFGEYDEQRLRVEPRARFPESVAPGMQFEGIPGDDTDDDDAIYTVTDVADDKVVLDANHPLAGIGVRFVCRVVDVRPATADEREHGMVADASSLILRPLP
jgi:FKBP-type peptidyl-prolyl cis-trans isomerase SlyD